MIEKRKKCYRIIKDLAKERKVRVKEIYEGEDVIDQMREAE